MSKWILLICLSVIGLGSQCSTPQGGTSENNTTAAATNNSKCDITKQGLYTDKQIIFRQYEVIQAGDSIENITSFEAHDDKGQTYVYKDGQLDAVLIESFKKDTLIETYYADEELSRISYSRVKYFSGDSLMWIVTRSGTGIVTRVSKVFLDDNCFQQRREDYQHYNGQLVLKSFQQLDHKEGDTYIYKEFYPVDGVDFHAYDVHAKWESIDRFISYKLYEDGKLRIKQQAKPL